MTMTTRALVPLLSVLYLWFSPAPAAAQRAELKTWLIDGATRRAFVYAPARQVAGAAVPVVLSFHGHGDNIENFQHTDMHAAWPEAVVVYVQGLPSRRDGLDGWQ